MPHNLYLHSALVQTRKIKRDPAGIKHALKMNFLDSTIAIEPRLFCKCCHTGACRHRIFQKRQNRCSGDPGCAQTACTLLGNKLAPILFAVALIAAGQSSTITGTLAGQIVMEGYLRLRINPWLRRLLTRLLAIGPAMVVIVLYGDNKIDALLILSQVILSLQLGFAIIPLIHFVSDKQKMEGFAIGTIVKILSWLVAIILVVLNLKMVVGGIIDFVLSPHLLIFKIAIIGAGLFLVGLLLLVTFYPWIQKKITAPVITIHPEIQALEKVALPTFDKVAVALDFSSFDEKLIRFALGQGHAGSSYILIHVVESVSARVHGSASDDLEARKDQEKLDNYVDQIIAMGYSAVGKLGYRNRKEENRKYCQKRKCRYPGNGRPRPCRCH